MTASYKVIQDSSGAICLLDLGPWDQFKTITADVALVISELQQANKLPPGKRLFYWDSEGDFGEIILKAGKFDQFALMSHGAKGYPPFEKIKLFEPPKVSGSAKDQDPFKIIPPVIPPAVVVVPAKVDIIANQGGENVR